MMFLKGCIKARMFNFLLFKFFQFHDYGAPPVEGGGAVYVPMIP